MVSSDQQTYKDFVLKIDRASEGTYYVEAQGPTGEAKTTFSQPFDEKDLQIFLLQIGRPRRTAVRGLVPDPVQMTLDFGSLLYNAIVSGNVRDAFASARHDAQREGYGLRLKLRLTGVPELVDWPWEFLYDGHDFLALSVDTPVVRYLDLPKPPRPMKVDLPLRILVTISSPSDQDPLNADAEQARVREALSAMEAEGMVELEFMTDVTLRAFQRTLRRAKHRGRPYHMWHYIGHGSFDPVIRSSVLMFCNPSGRSSPVGGFQLGTLFNGYPEMRLGLLNACEGARADRHDPFAGVAVALVERGMPAVIGMQIEISDRAAVTFSEEFYTALVDGLPVDAAITEARRAVFFIPNWVEWATPALYMRAPDGVLFAVQERRIRDAIREGVERPIQAESVRQVKGDAKREKRAPAGREVKQEKAPDIISTLGSFQLEMIRIPEGDFLMGSDPKKDKSAYNDEQPQHTVHLPNYYIAKTPVTNAQYLAFVKATNHRQPHHWESGKPPSGLEDHPVVYVSWYDATAYCRWLSSMNGVSCHLPSEAEWEKAARGRDGRIYPWGDAPPDESRCNFDNRVGQTKSIGWYSPWGDSLYGCVDMAGNVWEWTQSLFKSYPYDSKDGREEPGVYGARVLRGGVFNSRAHNVRCAYRGTSGPDRRLGYYGFRVCAAPGQASGTLSLWRERSERLGQTAFLAK